MGRSPTSSTMAWRPRSTNSLYESICCLTRPLSRMNSLVRFQSLVVVTAILSLSRIFFSKIFYNIPVKVGLSRRGAPSNDLDDIPRFSPDRSYRRVCGLYVGYLEGFDMVAFQDFLRFGGFEQNVSRDRKTTRLNSSHITISYA